MRLNLQEFSKRSKFGFFFQNIDGIFDKNLAFWKIARASKVAEECDWKSKNTQNVHS